MRIQGSGNDRSCRTGAESRISRERGQGTLRRNEGLTRRHLLEIRPTLEVHKNLLDLLFLDVDGLDDLLRADARPAINARDERVPPPLGIGTASSDARGGIVRVLVPRSVVLGADVGGRVVEPDRRIRFFERSGDGGDVERSGEQKQAQFQDVRLARDNVARSALASCDRP